MKVVLIGFACGGKTTVGKLVAARLGLPFVDTDELVCNMRSASVSEIFAKQGQEAFRKTESQVLRLIPQNAVVSCGGGTVLADGFAEFVQQNSTVIWLKVLPCKILQRLGDKPRPLFDGLSKDQLQCFVEDRNKEYCKYATIAINTDDISAQEVADKVVEYIGSFCG